MLRSDWHGTSGWNDLPGTNTLSFICEFDSSIYYTITVTAGANGTIDPAGDALGKVNLEAGIDQTFTLSPDAGYKVETVLMDGGLVIPVNNQYTFENVSADHTIEATFVLNTHTLTATAGANGSISPAGGVTVLDGADKTFTVAADNGYQVSELLVDGAAAGLIAGQYTFANVKADHSIAVSFEAVPPDEDPVFDGLIPGCTANTTVDYNGSFDAGDLNLLNTKVEGGQLVLKTGIQAIDPDNIVIPFAQEVAVTFLYEGAGFDLTNFGWMLAAEGVSGTKHEIYHEVNDENNNGVLDVSKNDETDRFGDTNGDGVVNAFDNRVALGTFDAGTELVFYIQCPNQNKTYYTKTAWNEDVYDSKSGECDDDDFSKTYYLGRPLDKEGSCTYSSNWMDAPALDRVESLLGLDFTTDDTATLDIKRGEKFQHVIVGAPTSKPNEWILGWEDLKGGGDMDHNDLVFKIERQTGGTAQLTAENAITPALDEAYFTGVTLQVYDSMPCPDMTEITYYLSLDYGLNWTEITAWDEVYAFSVNAEGGRDLGDKIGNWTPGNPVDTYRTIRVDFASMGIAGRGLLWKAELKSRNEDCQPKIIDLALDTSVATHGSFSRSSPVVKGNVIYSGSYETPAFSWTDKVMRGHLTATRLYDPADPDLTDELELWDAGEVLSLRSPASRAIYFPNISTGTVAGETIGTGDGTTRSFSGTLANNPIAATTLIISDQRETFQDKHTDVLVGSLGGSGTINRFTGEFQITFNTAPGNLVVIRAAYGYYAASSTLKPFTAAYVTNSMLGIDASELVPAGYVYDFNEDNQIDETDGDWLVNWVRGYKDGAGIAKEWLLGPIDHSVPAVASPPGLPAWYFGSATTEEERDSYLDFKSQKADRPTAVYVGSRDGMLHAFDAGKFRYGDNSATTAVKEERGYFEWEDRSADCPGYCSADCSKCPDYGTGQELWAFIPANLMPRLKNNRLELDDQAYVDASPALADVRINGTWKTVLLSAEGNGGDTIFCLDVTDPANPSFMWEFADPDLFRSRSSPSVAKIGRILVNGSAQWVAFFVSGKTYDASLYPSIYIIAIADGSVVQRVFLDAEPDGVGGVPSGQPTVIDSDGNGYVDRLYIGSDKGYLYKINIPDDADTVKYPISHCVINRDYMDDGDNILPLNRRTQPIYGSPVAVVDNGITTTGELQYNIMIFYGTGDSPYYDEDVNTDSTRYNFFAYRDATGKGQCDEDTVFLDWFYELPKGHRVFASAFAAAGNIYFGTSTSETEDPCEGGGSVDGNKGRIYAFTLKGVPVIKDMEENAGMEVGNIVLSPLVEDKHLYIKTQKSGLRSFGQGKYNNQGLIGGLPEIRREWWRELN
jgi:type IV pilus assembly protein PilY1